MQGNHFFGQTVANAYLDAKKEINNRLNPLWVVRSAWKSGETMSGVLDATRNAAWPYIIWQQAKKLGN